MMVLMMMLAQAANEVRLTVAGGIVMTVSISIVLGLNAFCIYRISRESKPAEHLHAPLEVETKDADE